MSSSVSTRPLPYVPFAAADAGLLLTAALIAWRTPGELAGGALLGVVFCVGLGAVLTVLPFVLNDARARDSALAERQRELAELVTTSTANASRWGTQWAAAATGLADAAGLATSSLAAAERLPAVFQEKADALAQRLAEVEQSALTRAATAALHERAARDEWDRRIEAAPATVAAQIERLVTDAESRLGATTTALSARLSEIETALTTLTVQLQRANEAAAAAVVPPSPAADPAAVAPVAATTPGPEVKRASGEAIMDPFLIPDDGYAALAAAMDSDRK
jgi:hypothetical protein